MRGHFFVVSLKRLAVVAICVVLFVSAFVLIRKNERQASAALLGLTVVVDAGHGGFDGGAVGRLTGIKESDINLEISKKLEAHLRRVGFTVVQTRTTKDGLYNAAAKNRKQSDMKKRQDIISKADADLVVSIHQNAFALQSVHGAGVYYKAGSDAGKTAAERIEKELLKIDHITKTQNKTGNFYILECTSVPSVLVECAYLSNDGDEKFVSEAKNQERLAYAVFCGIVKYFGVENY